MKERLGQFITFMRLAVSDNGQPSSSRVVSSWLCLSSMALLWFIVRHMMSLPPEKLQVWVGGLPAIILALATFAASPYGVNRVTEMFRKKDDPEKKEE